MEDRKSFTLVEMIAVLVIAGILAAIAVPQYMLAVERSKNREAISILKAIYQAEKMYALETEAGYTNDINKLDLEMPPAGGDWTYTITGTFTNATAVRTGGPSVRTWTVTPASPIPVCTGGTAKYCQSRAD